MYLLGDMMQAARVRLSQLTPHCPKPIKFQWPSKCDSRISNVSIIWELRDACPQASRWMPWMIICGVEAQRSGLKTLSA